MARRRLLLMWIVLSAGVVGSFQNCSKTGFKAAGDSTLSSQCQAAIKKAAPDFKLSPGELKCSDFNEYTCERRVFSPDVADMVHQLKECLPGDQICVDVTVRQFNTEAGRKSSEDPADFAPGGQFNNQDVNCSHRMVYRGVPLFDGRADSLEEALAQAMAACEKTMVGQ